MHFSKYQATGNDFILIDNRIETFPLSVSKIRSLCHRKFGVGADGLIFLDKSENADFSMRIFNSDGSEAESCGNGLLCFGKFILDLGFPERNYSVELLKEVVSIDCKSDGFSIQLNDPQKIQHFSVEKEIYLIDTGVPHAVVFVDSDCDFMRDGKRIREKYNANVNFVTLGEKLYVRTFERGVEGETFGCGTGAAAAASILALVKNQVSPVRLYFPGGELIVSFQKEGTSICNLTLIGSPSFVYSGHMGASIQV